MLSGVDGNDSPFGLGGNNDDVLAGGSGDDSLDGGDGLNRVYGGSGGDTSDGGDVIYVDSSVADLITNGTFDSDKTGWTIGNPTEGPRQTIITAPHGLTVARNPPTAVPSCKR